ESTATPLAMAQLAIAPVRHGSGTRLKILEYFAAGLPVVCPAKAAEGLEVEHGRHLLLAETPPDAVEAIRALQADPTRCAWLAEVTRRRYTYNFTWLGRPVIQLPQDLLAVQELIWQVRPDLIVETGIAHGGSLVHSASLLELLGGDRLVVGVDVDIRPHNRREIERHPLAHRIQLLEGSSTDAPVAAAVGEHARGRRA